MSRARALPSALAEAETVGLVVEDLTDVEVVAGAGTGLLTFAGFAGCGAEIWVER